MSYLRHCESVPPKNELQEEMTENIGECSYHSVIYRFSSLA